MYLEDVSDLALASIAAGFQRKWRGRFGMRADSEMVLEATRYCYLQLLLMQSAETALLASDSAAADDAAA